MKAIIKLEAERLEWSLKNFPDATPRSSIYKLRSEIKEVLKLLSKFENMQEQDGDMVNIIEEYADCLMCLFDSAGRFGITPEDMFWSFERKLEINKNRVWKKNPDNTYSHVK